MLVFWETTRACQLACRHCRASAIAEPLPGELTAAEGRALIDQVTGFGRPYPVLVLTGGDVLLRDGRSSTSLDALVARLPVALSPSVTPALTAGRSRPDARGGVKAVSISLDGATAATHEGVRGVEGHFERRSTAIRAAARPRAHRPGEHDVMRENVEELADVAALVDRLGVQRSGRSSSSSRSAAAVDGGAHARTRTRTSATSSTTRRATASSSAPSRRRSSAAWSRAGTATGRRRGSARCTGGCRGGSRELLGEPRTSRRAHRRRAPATARASSSSPTTARSIPAGFLPLGLGNVRGESLARRSTARARCCARSGPAASAAAAALRVRRSLRRLAGARVRRDRRPARRGSRPVSPRRPTESTTGADL